MVYTELCDVSLLFSFFEENLILTFVEILNFTLYVNHHSSKFFEYCSFDQLCALIMYYHSQMLYLSLLFWLCPL